MSIVKQCSCCKGELPTNQFNKDKSRIDKLRIYCKDCDRLKGKNYYKNNHLNVRDYKKYIGNSVERNRQSVSNYRKTKKAKITKEKYNQRDYVKKIIFNSSKKWRRNNPNKTKIYDSRKRAKRKKYSFIELFDNPYPPEIDIDYHHINDIVVVPIPRKIHSRFSCNNKEKHRELCNKWIDNLFDVNNILGD